MKKGLKILCAFVALALSFLLGWRVMPKVWPQIREKVVYPVFPQLQPTPKPTQEPYVPSGNAAFGDAIAHSDSLIYYFYKDQCPYCRALEPLTAGLPETVTLPDGTKSRVRLVCLNKMEEAPLAVITAYYDAHAVPEERRYVPAMVIGDRYLYLEEEISGALLDALIAGEGLDTPLLDGNDRIP